MRCDLEERVSSDLVEYFIVEVPALDSLESVASALSELDARETIRVLDVVVISKDDDGRVTALELDDVDSMAAVRGVRRDVGGLLSDHDVALAATALRPGSVGAIVVTEDRWAEPLSVATQRAGGQIVAGERLPTVRVASALADRADEHPSGG